MRFKFFISMLAVLLFTSVNAFAAFPVQKVVPQAVTMPSSQPQEQYTSAASSSGGKSQVVALLLCVFVGLIGIHRFYLGYTWQGIVQILTLGGLGIWTLIDLVRIILGDLQPKDGEYDKTL